MAVPFKGGPWVNFKVFGFNLPFDETVRIEFCFFFDIDFPIQVAVDFNVVGTDVSLNGPGWFNDDFVASQDGDATFEGATDHRVIVEDKFSFYGVIFS